MQQVLQKFAEVVLQHFADLFAVDIVEDDGTITRAVTRYADPAVEAVSIEMRNKVPLSITAAYGYPRVIKTGKSQFLPGVPTRIRQLLMPGTEAHKLEFGIIIRSYMCVPLIACDRTLGAITAAITQGPTPFTSDDLVLMEEIAAELAECIDKRMHKYESAG